VHRAVEMLGVRPIEGNGGTQNAKKGYIGEQVKEDKPLMPENEARLRGLEN